MPSSIISRRQSLRLLAGLATAATAGRFASTLRAAGAPSQPGRREFNVRDHGAVGNGTALDTAAIQRAIDAAAAVKGRVIIPGGRTFLVGTLELKSGIDFHLADDHGRPCSKSPGVSLWRTRP